MTFEKLNVRPEIVRGLKEEGIITPTTIQEKTIPLILSDKDVIGISRTGSGKTAAFGVPILEKIAPRKGLQAIIITPTRELTVQISQELYKFSKYLRFSIATVFGGVSIGPQIEKIKRSEIVVGTPGRLLDHLERRTLDLSRIRVFVLDEADKMVEMGFIDDISRILRYTPNNRQMILFGATISEEVEDIKKRYMKDPVTVRTELRVKEDLLEQCYYNTPPHEKFSLLVHLLKKDSTGQTIIFCSTRRTVELVVKNLRAQGIKAEMIHGKLTQNRRLNVISGFNKGNSRILVASAVAARGLDIKGVTDIINYDLSQDPQEYIHRVGRTARAGKKGKAVTLLSPRDHSSFANIIHRYKIDVKELPKENFPRVRFQAENRPAGFNRGNSFRRSSTQSRHRSFPKRAHRQSVHNR